MSRSKTRVVNVRLILSSLPPHIELPVSVDHPMPPDARSWLFGLMQDSHVVRMDVMQLSPGEFEGLRSSGWPMRQTLLAAAATSTSSRTGPGKCARRPRPFWP